MTETTLQKDDRLALELASFRQEWHDELLDKVDKEKEPADAGDVANAQDAGLEAVLGVSDQLSLEEQAAKIFLRGAELEQEKRMHEAVLHYKKAMRLVPDIEVKVGNIQKDRNAQERKGDSQLINTQQDTEDDNSLASLVVRFQNVQLDVPCEKEFSSVSTHVSVLPSELLLYIFRWVISDQLDLRSLQNLSLVCKWFFICARDDDTWKRICLRIWSSSCPLEKDIAWHSYYLANAHPRYDGVYVSVMSYIRPGEKGLDSFYRPYHFVEYYRFVRFFPNGTVLVYTTPNDPYTVIPLMEIRHCHTHDIGRGRYRLTPGKVNIVLKKYVKDHSVGDSRRRRRDVMPSAGTEQTFYMELDISRSRRHKRGHQLTWAKYSCDVYNRSTGQSCSSEFDLCDFKPLVFSRVKSYLSSSAMPLQ